MFSTVPEYLFTDSFIPGMANSVLEKDKNICVRVFFSYSKNVIPVFQKIYSRLPKMLFPSSKNVIPVFQKCYSRLKKCYSRLPKMLLCREGYFLLPFND
jgi:hypothetical protein